MKRSVALTVAALIQASGAGAQVVLDRADPTVIERTVPRPVPVQPVAPTATSTAPSPPVSVAPVTGVVRAITVMGQDELPPEIFAAAITPFISQVLGRAELTRLAGAVADAARARDYPFATARIERQALTDGILHVTLDLGAVDAVRVIGARNAAADRILQHALVTGRGVRRAALERAIGLVGDLPGVRVTGSRYLRQDGFGILLVTIEADRASAYVQLDNRGSDEVGPFRSTILASLRSLVGPADELGVIVSQTPFQPDEFAFLRARYSMPVGDTGTVVSVSGSVARSHPGGALKALDIVGRSADVALDVRRPLSRSRARSLWASAELRGLGSNQRLRGARLRRDRLATLTGALDGTARLAGGVAHGELTGIAGLPIAGVTHDGDPLASRTDGDARFVAGTYAIDWVRPIGRPFSVAVASAGQLASRPLLATEEIGAGGPAFVRAYDDAERTGDRGVLGSLEVRADTGRIPGSAVTRAQLFGFVDGGTVGNLRGGVGGGTLVSTGAGARIGTGTISWMAEVAVPLNADRFDTGDRRPRFSFRVARAF